MTENVTSENKTTEEYSAELASAGSRFLAYIIDSIIFGFIGFAIYVLFAPDIFSDDFQLKDLWKVEAVRILIISLITCYFLAIYKWQATIGKRILAIHVVSINGAKVGFRQAFIRSATFLCIFLALYSYGNNINQDFTVDTEFEEFILEKMPIIHESAQQEELNILEYMLTTKGIIQLKESLSSLDSLDVETFNVLFTKSLKDFAFNPFQIFALLLAIIWHITVLFTKQKTAIHDMIAKTRVIKGRL